MEYMHVVGQFPVQRLEFHLLMSVEEELSETKRCPMAWVTRLLRSVRHYLEYLQFSSVALCGKQQDAEDFVRAIGELRMFAKFDHERILHSHDC